MLTYHEQDDLNDEDYTKLVKLSLDQKRPVLLDILDFDQESGDLYIDLSDCYRALYFEYQNCQKELRSTVDLLEANLWSTWSRKNAKYWGKKRAGKHVEGLLIDVIEQLTQSFEESFDDLEPVFTKFDLYRRKLQTFETISLQSLTKDKTLNFDSSFRTISPSWTDPEPEVIKEVIISSASDTVDSVCILHRANYDATLLLMVDLFHWNLSGNMAEKVMASHEYQKMLESWLGDMIAEWKQTRTVRETTYYYT